MRGPNPELERRIREECLALLMEKEPEEIGMREIAARAGVSATALYYYFADKDRLFDAVKRDCLERMDAHIARDVAAAPTMPETIKAGLSAFRDWCFENPRIALLVMGRFRPNEDPSAETQAPYYRSTALARDLLDRAVAEGFSKSADTLLDAALAVAALWGAIESILYKRTVPEYWERGVEFTDRMIELVCGRLLNGKEG